MTLSLAIIKGFLKCANPNQDRKSECPRLKSGQAIPDGAKWRSGTSTQSPIPTNESFFLTFDLLTFYNQYRAKSMKIGVLRETKNPPDRRVALPPGRILELKTTYPDIEIVVQPSELRCYKDDEFLSAGLVLQEDVSDCDVLIGVKEVVIDTLIPGKTYFFFSHVAKEQPYNRGLLQAILARKIRLIDYEYLTNSSGTRLIAFGRWAGIVGAYNALRGWGERTKKYKILPAHECHDREDMDAQLDKVKLDTARIVISGGGRVARGALETMSRLGIREVKPEDYLENEYSEPVFCRVDPWHYVAPRDGSDFDLKHFFDNPKGYVSTFKPYTHKTDIYIAAHYWDPDSPRMFEIDDMKSNDFIISMIADISCDINGSVPSTTRATTIAEPFYGYDPENEKELDAFSPLPPVTMMTVDNLPGELPRDASAEFAGVLVCDIIPKLIGPDPEGVIERATIAENGKLTERYGYLEGYVKGE